MKYAKADFVKSNVIHFAIPGRQKCLSNTKAKR